MSAALGCGIDAKAFFAATPYLVARQVRAVQRARRDAAVAAAWYGEALARAPRLPDLAALLAVGPVETESEGAQDAARGWAAANGLVFTEERA